MKHINEENELSEFNKFLQTKADTPPEALTTLILNQQSELLLPSPFLVFTKLIIIHGFFGTLSLSVCNQFGLNPFNTTLSLSLSDYFMSFGHSTCMAFCGILFVGCSLVAARFILSAKEFFVLRKHYLLQVSTLCILSLAIFINLGAHVTFSIAALWVLGAFAGSSVPVFINSRWIQTRA
jgi:hypothetical protein